MSLNPAKTLGESLRVTMLAPGADLGAAANGVPRGIGPFDLGDYGQDSPPRNI